MKKRVRSEGYDMKKNLYASLAPCKKEEEVKAEFCKFFKMKIKALGNIDHYTEQVLFEFKYDRNFKSVANVAAVLAPVVGNITPAMPDGAAVENGALTLRSGSPLVLPAGAVPLAPFTVQVWVSATDKGLGDANTDTIFKIASSPDGKDDSVFWTWTRYGKKWSSGISGFDESKKVGNGKMLLDGQMHLYTVTGEKTGNGLALKFCQDDTCFGDLTTKSAWKKPPMLVLGGFVTPTYDEVRVYSRALSHADIINSLNLGPDKLPEAGKGK